MNVEAQLSRSMLLRKVMGGILPASSILKTGVRNIGCYRHLDGIATPYEMREYQVGHHRDPALHAHWGERFVATYNRCDLRETD